MRLKQVLSDYGKFKRPGRMPAEVYIGRAVTANDLGGPGHSRNDRSGQTQSFLGNSRKRLEDDLVLRAGTLG